MTTKVIVKQLPGSRFRVTGRGRFAVTAQGRTREEAIAKFQRIAARIADETTEELTIEIPVSRNGSHPIMDAPTGNNAKLLASIGRGADFSEEYKEQLLAAIERSRQETNALQVD